MVEVFFAVPIFPIFKEIKIKMKPLVTLLALFFAITIYGQKLPPIGSEKGVKEKFIIIKKGLPDIKKNLTKKDEDFEDTYNVIFEMGNGIVNFEESEDDQTLTIKFSSGWYFSGSMPDFKDYYNKLVSMIGEVFGPVYISERINKEKTLTTTFFEKGKNMFNSKVTITVTCDWILDKPDITIDVISQKPFNKS